MRPTKMLDIPAILARYDALRDSGSSVVWCEGAILIEFGVHPTELRRMQAEASDRKESN